MSLDLQKSILAIWRCDWCLCQVTTDFEVLPPHWVDGDGECGDQHFCSDSHRYLSQRAWENGFEAAIEAQSAYYEEERLKWMKKTCNGTEDK